MATPSRTIYFQRRRGDIRLSLYTTGPSPFFVLVSSPFAQLGFVGIKIFNSICALSAALLMSLSAKRMGLSKITF